MTTTAWDETTRTLVRNTREKEKHKHFGTVHDYTKLHGSKLSTITFKSFLSTITFKSFLSTITFKSLLRKQHWQLEEEMEKKNEKKKKKNLDDDGNESTMITEFIW